MRFHLVDRIDELQHGHHITGVKCISLADDVFNEHFPGYPVFPGSLVLESLAQLAGALFEITMNEQKREHQRCVLSIVRKMAFRRPVGPGDRLLLRADQRAMQDDYGVAAVRAEVDGELCADGELLFSFLHVPSSRLQAAREELYNICTRHTRVIRNADPT